MEKRSRRSSIVSQLHGERCGSFPTVAESNCLIRHETKRSLDMDAIHLHELQLVKLTNALNDMTLRLKSLQHQVDALPGRIWQTLDSHDGTTNADIVKGALKMLLETISTPSTTTQTSPAASKLLEMFPRHLEDKVWTRRPNGGQSGSEQSPQRPCGLFQSLPDQLYRLQELQKNDHVVIPMHLNIKSMLLRRHDNVQGERRYLTPTGKSAQFRIASGENAGETIVHLDQE
ncbi:hypothetical protein LEN26_000714 [Aphanomyces euteiches]|nr:hypothetical protein LEN26_005231 [Aphanomyces euteiches]KAH9162965.1 hypothetical protein LEN26_000714 [Aphanomyces euteiches]KAH9191882.1 hypothetical protein AeNC1_006149 [Aphanomyces euteiches]